MSGGRPRKLTASRENSLRKDLEAQTDTGRPKYGYQTLSEKYKVSVSVIQSYASTWGLARIAEHREKR